MSLPKPYYQDDAVTLYHGDCRSALCEMPLADAVVTDPPFGIGWARGTWTDDADSYPEFIMAMVRESEALIPNGWCYVFQAMRNVARYHEWFPAGWRIFAACKNFSQIRPTGVWHSWDPVVFWSVGTPKKWAREGINRDYHVGNVAGSFLDGNDHPCPRPVDTMRHICSMAAPPGGLIIDPFAGSGTTLRAAKDLGRKAIGIEIEERYCEIAARRCAQEVLL